MTVSTSVNKTIVNGNGAQTQFAFNFIGVAAAYIGVILTDAGGNETVLVQGSASNQFQVALSAAVEGALWGLGGTVTYNPSGTPIPAGSTLTIFRTLPLTQAISLQNQLSLETVGNGAETALDIIEMQLQQVSESIARAIAVPIVDATPPAPLPPIAQRANQGAAFDASGNLIAAATPASGIISSAMQPVVDAATLALGRTALGLGNIAVENIGASLQDDGAGNVRVNFPVVSVSTNQAPVAANHQTRYMVGAAAAFTLARSNTLWSGYEFWVYAIGGPVTITPDSHDAIGSLATGTALVIPQGSVARIHTNALVAGTWWTDLTPPAVPMPQGYLTPVSGVPVPNSDVSTHTLFYTPFKGQYVPIWTGAQLVAFPFAELSASLNSGYTGNAAYDWFIALVSGAPTLLSGPAWRNPGQSITGATNATPIVITAGSHGLSTGDTAVVSNVLGNTAANGIWSITKINANSFSLDGSIGNGAYTASSGQFAARGAGVGTTQLTRSAGGILTNAVSMTARNGTNTFTIPANQATYIGSGLMNSGGTIVSCLRAWQQNAIYGVYNAYNQQPIYLKAGVPQASWTYASATWRPANNSVNNSLTAFFGLPESPLRVAYKCRMDLIAINAEGNIGIGMGSTTAPAGSVGDLVATVATGADVSVQATHISPPILGAIVVTAIEAAVSGTVTFEGGEQNSYLTAEWLG